MKPKSDDVANFLQGHLGEAESVIALDGGNWSNAYAFESKGRDYVVRFGEHEDDYAKDRVASNFASENLPVPRVTEVGKAFDGYFAISERVFGKMLDDLDKAKMKAMVPSVLKTLDAMRAIDLSKTTGYGRWDASGRAPYASWRDYLLDITNDYPGRRIHGWSKRLAESPVGNKHFLQAFENLKQLVEICPEDRHIIHQDLLYRNVLVSDDRISAIIDWGNSLYGDFLYDLAWFSYWSPWYPAMEGINWEAEAQKHYEEIGLAVPRFKERLLCYKVHIGMDAQIYNAYTQRWDDLKANTKRTLELAGI